MLKALTEEVFARIRVRPLVSSIVEPIFSVFSRNYNLFQRSLLMLRHFPSIREYFTRLFILQRYPVLAQSLIGHRIPEKKMAQIEIIEQFKKFYALHNGYPIQYLERVIISMLQNQFYGKQLMPGILTSTNAQAIEHLLVAYKERSDNQSIQKPKVIIAKKVMPLFEKVARKLGIELVVFDSSEGVESIKSKIDDNTILLVISSPLKPQPQQSAQISMLLKAIPTDSRIDIHNHAPHGFIQSFMAHQTFPDFRNGITSLSVDMDHARDSQQVMSALLFNCRIPLAISASDPGRDVKVVQLWVELLAFGKETFRRQIQGYMQMKATPESGYAAVLRRISVDEPECMPAAENDTRSAQSHMFQFLKRVYDMRCCRSQLSNEQEAAQVQEEAHVHTATS